MTLLTTTSDIQYSGTIGQDTFAYNFRVDLKTDMNVTLDGVPVAQGDFTVTGLGTPSGGNVILDTPLVSPALVILQRIVPSTQEVDYQPFDAFPAETHEGALDKLTMLTQQNTAETVRSIRFPVGDASDGLLPDAAIRANNFLAFDNLGDIDFGFALAFTQPERDKLAAIEDNADVTDTASVDAAGAVMDTDYTQDDSTIHRTSLGAYVSIKHNLAGTTTPGSTDDSNAGYSVGSTWIDQTNDSAFTCVDDTPASALWITQGTISGAVTSVGATAPITSSGGSTPTIALPGLAAIGTELNDLDRSVNNKVQFTPGIRGLTNPGTPTIGINDSTFYRIGNLVFITIKMRVTNLGGMTGNIVLDNMPFNINESLNIPLADGSGFTGLTSAQKPFLFFNSSGQIINLVHTDHTTNTGGLFVDDTLISANLFIGTAFSYTTSDA